MFRFSKSLDRRYWVEVSLPHSRCFSYLSVTHMFSLGKHQYPINCLILQFLSLPSLLIKVQTWTHLQRIAQGPSALMLRTYDISLDSELYALFLCLFTISSISVYSKSTICNLEPPIVVPCLNFYNIHFNVQHHDNRLYQ